MGKFLTFFFIIFLGILGYFAVLNTETVTIALTESTIYELPKIALIIISSTIGALLMFFIYFVKDTRRFIRAKQMEKHKRKEEQVNLFYSKAIHFLLGKKVDEAVSQLQHALRENPDHIQSLLRMGDICMQRSDFRSAFEYLQKAKSLDPENIETLFYLIRLRESSDQMNDALDTVDDILDIEPDNLSALYKKRELLERLSQWDDLVNLQKTLIKLKHDEREQEEEKLNLVGYKYEYGRQCLENNEIEKAKKAFKTILRLERGFIPAHLGIAEVMLREDHTEEAINYLEKTYEQTNALILLARLEDLIINTGEPARLIRIYRNSISEQPDNDLLKLLQGKLYYRLEMIDDALDVLNSVDPGVTYSELYKLRGGIYLKRNQYESAIEEFLKVIDMRKALWLPYCCSHCGYSVEGWSGRCPSCRRWNSFYYNLQEGCIITQPEEHPLQSVI